MTQETATPSTTSDDLHPQAAVVEALLAQEYLGTVRMLMRFQALTLPKGVTLTRGYTRTRAANEINDLVFGGRNVLTRASKPPKGASDLRAFLSWAITLAEQKLCLRLYWD